MTVTTMARSEQDAPAEPQKKKGKTRLLLVAVVVLAVAAAAWWFLLRPAPGDTEPEPGAVLPLESIQVNLAGGHYLKIGIALQASAEVEEELDGSKALDATIELFSGQSVERLGQPVYRDRLREKLVHELEESYEGEVLDVYLTDFVTQ